MNGKKVNSYRGLIGKHGGKGELVRHRCRVDVNI